VVYVFVLAVVEHHVGPLANDVGAMSQLPSQLSFAHHVSAPLHAFVCVD